MLPRDVFARTLEFPKDFSGDTIDPESLFQFSAMKKGGADYAMSVASRFQLCAVDMVHRYGLAVVEAKNARHRLEKGVDPDPRKKYVGFYDFFAECVDGFILKTYKPRIKWRPEVGQKAHFQLELIWDGLGDKNLRKDDRRAASRALFDSCFGPEIFADAQEDSDLAGCIASLETKPRPE